ncbi:MAG: hypothetical protein ACFCUR_13080 [Rhodomicrobiaceae bacterium]
MGRFLIGLIAGVAMAFGYVRWNVSPGIMEMPDKLRGNIVSTAIEGDLYDLDKPLDARRRALEVFFQNRAQFAAGVDAEFAHPFLNALYLKRVIREARQLHAQWEALDMALDKPALRAAMEKKHGVSDDMGLKQAMLFDAYQDKDFLRQWVAAHETAPTRGTLLPLLKKLSAEPQ